MYAFHPKPDIAARRRRVRFVPKRTHALQQTETLFESQARASKIMLNGVSAARRKRV
jgi:hypothetical protein